MTVKSRAVSVTRAVAAGIAHEAQVWDINKLFPFLDLAKNKVFYLPSKMKNQWRKQKYLIFFFQKLGKKNGWFLFHCISKVYSVRLHLILPIVNSEIKHWKPKCNIFHFQPLNQKCFKILQTVFSFPYKIFGLQGGRWSVGSFLCSSRRCSSENSWCSVRTLL